MRISDWSSDVCSSDLPLVDAVLAEFGRIDILVNNAGIIRRADAVDFTEADWDAVMDTNLKTLFFLCQAVGRHMIARIEKEGGRSEEHTSELQSLMRISYAVLCLKKKKHRRMRNK